MTTPARYRQFDRSYYATEGYEGYEEWNEEAATKLLLRPLLQLIGDRRRSFLDVGCGMGGSILALRKLGHEAHGTEVSAHCLETSPAREHMSFGESFALHFGDKAFDVVLCSDIFQYLTRAQAQQSVAEFCRVAKEYVSLWVFDPSSYGWSQEDNPDDARIEDTRGLTPDDYAAWFRENGYTSAGAFSDFDEDSGMPEWHLLFRKGEG